MDYFCDSILTATYDISIPTWTMNSKVISGDYECYVSIAENLAPFSDVPVEIDILLLGSDHWSVFKINDTIRNAYSLKKIIINVGKEVAYVKGMTNPYITVKDNDITLKDSDITL
jgi:hypothetical protein